MNSANRGDTRKYDELRCLFSRFDKARMSISQIGYRVSGLLLPIKFQMILSAAVRSVLLTRLNVI